MSDFEKEQTEKRNEVISMMQKVSEFVDDQCDTTDNTTQEFEYWSWLSTAIEDSLDKANEALTYAV